MTCHGFDQEQPISFCMVQHYIRHFAVQVWIEAEFAHKSGITITPFVAGVSSVNQGAARSKTGSKFLNNVPNEFAMVTWAKGYVLIWRDFDGDKVLFARFRVTSDERLVFIQIGYKCIIPRRSFVQTQ